MEVCRQCESLVFPAVVFSFLSKLFLPISLQVSENLPTCQELAIIAQPFDVKNATGSSGVPPYYMMSFAVGGLPKTDLIGTDKGALKWTVNHPVGELAVSVRRRHIR
jgi:hypothetical protein